MDRAMSISSERGYLVVGEPGPQLVDGFHGESA
jgi:hypothetical protein